MNKHVVIQRKGRTGRSWALALGLVSAGVIVAAVQVMSGGEGARQSVDAVSSAASATAASGDDGTRTHVGTEADGRFAQGNGDLLMSPELIKRFEYHLAAIGERTVPQIREAILNDLRRSLNAKGLSEATRLLDKYLQFKTALASVQAGQSSDGSAAALAHSFQVIRDLRAQYFDAAEIAALFAQGDEYEDYMVRKMTILQDKSLTEAQRREALASLAGQLSPAARADVEQPLLHLTLSERVDQARREGATAAQIREIRTEMVGADATRRLEALDREEADWQDRIQQYKAARASDPARAEQLKNQLFSPNEQLRLTAYE